MPDFLEETKREIAQRLEQLKPLVEEYDELKQAHEVLKGHGRSHIQTQRPSSRRQNHTHAAQSWATGHTSGTSRRRRGRPRGSGTRAHQALELVQGAPGITIPEIAEKMGIKQNYLYRVLPRLESEGEVRKEGRGWHPVAVAQ